MQRRPAIAALCVGVLAACHAARLALASTLPPGKRWHSTLQVDHPLAGVIWQAARDRRVDARTLMSELHAARYRLLGEVHDNPDHHAIQLELLHGLADAGLKPVVAFEQFDREHDATLQQRLAGGNVMPEDIANAVSFDRAGWQWDFYRPLVELALRLGMPLRAANLSRSAARRIVKEGLQSVGPERIAAMRLEMVWSRQREEILRGIIFDGHCRALPERLLPAMAAAQRVRDATLAEALLDSGTDGAVLIAGNGHVRRDLAVPLYLRAAAAGAAICALGILEVEAGITEPGAYVRSGAEPAFDFVVFTPAWRRPDPCAAFRPPTR